MQKKKTVFITGASGNLGISVVKKFLSSSYKVIGTVLPDDVRHETDVNPDFEKVPVDLLDEQQSAQAVEYVISKYGEIDVAVLTAGGFAMGNIVETRMADINQQYRLNFETAYNIVQPVFSQMLKQNNGRIFLIGSRPGLSAKSGKGMVAYSLSKSLIFHLAELLNGEAKGKNVVTSVIVPGTIDTPQNRQAMPDANPENWAKPDEIAEIIYFYTTQEAAIIREPVIKVYNNS